MGRFQILMPIALFCLGIIWCREMVPRWREDWEIISGKTGDSNDKCVTWFLWILTAVVLLAMLLMLLIGVASILQWTNS